MPLTRAKKKEKVGPLAAELEHSTSAIIGTFAGLTAAKDVELRKTIRNAGGSYHVVKNKLAARAGEGTQI
jgi:large subunit ribosomal protein L10